MDNDALDSVDQFESAVIAILDCLCGLAPAAVQNGIGCGNARGGRCILRPHDADKDIERGPGVAARERTDFREGLSHSNERSPVARNESCARLRAERSSGAGFQIPSNGCDRKPKVVKLNKIKCAA
jgi:hypothetical protein